jgi:hypothetical protein
MNITLRIVNIGFHECFLGKMLPDGRVTVPRIVIAELEQRMPNLKDNSIEVTLEPI